jgi:hypothetical protein
MPSRQVCHSQPRRTQHTADWPACMGRCVAVLCDYDTDPTLQPLYRNNQCVYWLLRSTTEAIVCRHTVQGAFCAFEYIVIATALLLMTMRTAV